MRLGGKMQHGPWLVLRQQAIEQFAVANVPLHKEVARIALQAVQVVQVACVGELVQIEHRLVAVRQPVQNEIGANKACAACNQNHGFPWMVWPPAWVRPSATGGCMAVAWERALRADG